MSTSLTPIRDALIALGESTTEQRALLDARPQFVPIDVDALRISLGRVISQKPEDVLDPDALKEYKDILAMSPAEQEDYAGILRAYETKIQSETISLEELANKIQTWLDSNYGIERTFNIASGTLGGQPATFVEIDKLLRTAAVSGRGESPGILFKNGNRIIGVLYPNYRSAGNAFFTRYLNKEIVKFINKKWRHTITTQDGKAVNIKAAFDIGHIISQEGISNTPLALKFQQMLAILQNASNQSSDVKNFTARVQGALSSLEQKSTYGPQIIATLEKEFGSNLQILKQLGVNIVIIQESAENRYLYGSLIEGRLGAEIAKLLPEQNFSRNLIDEFQFRYEGVHKGKTKFASSKHSKKLETINVPVPKVKLSKAKPSNKDQKLPVSKPRRVKEVYTDNLVSLQRLLDVHLVDVVKNNMGDGGRRDILNLRSGRFAGSVKVTSLSVSRQGMITAFYTYMKNPYATFSQGGRQQFPRSRDPKLLISQSIRELARQIVSNRLRAVAT